MFSAFLANLSDTNSWYRGFIQGKTRIALAWIFSIILIFSAREYPNIYGIALCFVGASIRFWASGYLRKDSRLSVGGPYALTRNPLYLGTYLMALGTALAIENFWLLAGLTIAFAAVYHFIILDEEAKLMGIFGDSYQRYLTAVPRFFPRPWPVARSVRMEINPAEEHHRFSWAVAMKNKAYEAYASFLGLMGFVMLVAYFWKQFEN